VLLNGTVQATFAYDGFGRRVKKTNTTGAVQYVWDGDQLILEADGSGTTLQTYTYYPGTDQLHSVTAGGVTYYASTEPATGDVNGLVRGSDNAVVAQYAYTPWGEFDGADQPLVNGARVNSLRWKGLSYDAETGLYYMRARYYDPKMRRFISEDPIGLDGGINEYVFVGGDPVNRSDPSGMIPQCFNRWIPAATVTAGRIFGSPDDTPSATTSGGYWVTECSDDGRLPPGYQPTQPQTPGAPPPAPGGGAPTGPARQAQARNTCVSSAIGNGMVWGGTTGFVTGARVGFGRGVQVAGSRAFVRTAVVIGAAAAIGTFEVGGSGGPVAFIATRATEYAGVVSAYTLLYGIGGAVSGALLSSADNMRQCFTDASAAY
jgi:RHS repeat-associated protein